MARYGGTPTPRSCPCCAGGGTDARASCILCGGDGTVDPVVAARWTAQRDTRVTRVEDKLRETNVLLEKHVHERTSLVDLLNEGKGLLRKYGAASRLPAQSQERTDAVLAYEEFIGRATRAIAKETP